MLRETADPAPAPEVDEAAYRAAVGALFRRRPERMVPGLERIRAVCALLGEPQRAYPAVHVTGTNGKTTIARITSAVLESHGLRTGTYTSPHLQDVRERIRVEGRPIPPEALLATLERLAPALAEAEAQRGEMVTFFEVLTALAATHFAASLVDVGVLEVGMGGRWDATNTCDGRVAVVNSVALDHAELGSTVEQVAAEKAGIIKPGATVVVGAQEAAVDRLLRRVTADMGGRLLRAGSHFAVRRRVPHARGQRVEIESPLGQRVAADLPLRGAHQAANAAVAVAAAESMLARRGAALSPARAARALATVRSPGRYEVFARPDGAPVVLDGAHNPAGAAALAATLRQEPGSGRRVLVLGVLGDKDVETIVGELSAVADEVVATRPRSPRAAPAERVAEAARRSGRRAWVTQDVPAAIALAWRLAGPADTVIVAGSLYTVGEARDVVGGRPG